MKRTGLTLVELLVAMALLSTLGALMVQLVRNSFTLYEQSDRRGDLYDSGLHVLNILEDDLTALAGAPDGRLLLETRTGDGEVELLLRGVRTLPGGEQGHPVLRRAGARPGGTGVFAGEDPGPGVRDAIAPPAGLLEFVYALVQDPDSPVGVFTLYRGERAPALAPGGFFAGDPTIDGAYIRQNLRPVADGVLFLAVLCLGQHSSGWDEEAALARRASRDGATLVWDSTRGYLEAEQFPLAVGPGSRGDPRDDVFPRRVRIVAQVARPSDPEARLVRVLPASATQLEVTTTEHLPPVEAEDRLVKLGNEWIALGAMGGGWVKGARGARASGTNFRHPVGTPVYHGRVFRKTLDVPVGRSAFSGGGR